MRVQHAKAMGRQWVAEEVKGLPGFLGAYFAGSVAGLSDAAVLPPTSDLDINVVYDQAEAPIQRGKLLYHGVLLDVTPLPVQEVELAEQVLGHYHLAGGFRAPSIISDPSGHLTGLHAAVSRDFAQRHWVQSRCRHARRRVVEGLASLDPAQPFAHQVLAWIFPTGVTTHILLSAGLRNPTVRRRYLAVRELLAEYGHLDVYETLLELLGATRVTKPQAKEHLAALADVFDVAGTVIRTPFSFASDISMIARPLAIDGSEELIARGFQREAMFWMAVTSSRCQQVLAADAPQLQAQFEPAYQRLLADLDIASPADLLQRAEQVRAHLGTVWDVSEALRAANPGIPD